MYLFLIHLINKLIKNTLLLYFTFDYLFIHVLFCLTNIY